MEAKFEFALNLIAAGLAFFFFCVIIFNWVRDRRASDWSNLNLLNKGIRVARDSLVWLSGYFLTIASAILANLDGLANALGQPQVVDILNKYFDPKMVGYVLLASSLWFMWARARTLTKPVITPKEEP